MRQNGQLDDNVSLTEQMSVISDVEYAQDGGDFAETGHGLFANNHGTSSKHRGRFSKRSLVFIVLAVLCLAFVASIASSFVRYSHKAAPGVSLAGQSVSGKDSKQIRSMLERLLDNTKVKIYSDDNKTITAPIRLLGVKVPVDRVVDEVISAKSNPLIRLLPWVKQNILLTADINEDALGRYIGEQFITAANRATPSAIHYDDKQKIFVVDPGKDGSLPQVDPVIHAIHTALSKPGSTVDAKLSYKNSVMPISVDSAKEAASKANDVIKTVLVITNGKDKKVTLPQDVIVSWLNIEPNEAKGTIGLTLDTDQVRSYAKDELAKALGQDMVPQQDIVDDAHNVLISYPVGKDGVEIADTDMLADQIVEALQQHQSQEITAKTKVKKFEIKQVVAPMRIVIDKSTQRLAAYRNGNLEKAFNVVTGSLSQAASPTGTFVVTGHDGSKSLVSSDKAYIIGDSQWILTLNNGTHLFGSAGEAPGIRTGDPINWGFSASVALNPADAHWLYVNSPEGTVVQIIGADPTGAVRNQ